MEDRGVYGQITEDSAPDRSRSAVAGHVKTDHGTQPFFVGFANRSDGKRIPVRITFGDEVLHPPADTR